MWTGNWQKPAKGVPTENCLKVQWSPSSKTDWMTLTRRWGGLPLVVARVEQEVAKPDRGMAVDQEDVDLSHEKLRLARELEATQSGRAS